MPSQLGHDKHAKTAHQAGACGWKGCSDADANGSGTCVHVMSDISLFIDGMTPVLVSGTEITAMISEWTPPIALEYL